MRRGEPLLTAALALRMLPWAITLPVLKHAVPITRLARLMSAGRARERDQARERRIVRAAWWASHVQARRFPDNCLERSLLAFRYLGRAGAMPTLVLGVARDAGPVVGHAWVLVGGEPVADLATESDAYVPVASFTADGERT